MKTLSTRCKLYTIINAINDLNHSTKYRYDSAYKSFYHYSKEHNAFLFMRQIHDVKELKKELVEEYNTMLEEVGV